MLLICQLINSQIARELIKGLIVTQSWYICRKSTCPSDSMQSRVEYLLYSENIYSSSKNIFWDPYYVCYVVTLAMLILIYLVSKHNIAS